MSLHVEWEDHARDLEVSLMTADRALEILQPDVPIEEPYVLVLASGGGGALAVGGDIADLNRLADRIKRLVEKQ